MRSRSWKAAAAAAPLVLVAAVLGAVLTVLGQVLSWGVIGDAQGVPVLLRVVAVIGALLALALCAPSVVEDRGVHRATAVVTLLAGGGTLWWLLDLLSAQIDSRVGGWFAVVGAAVVALTGALALVGSFAADMLGTGRRSLVAACVVGVLVIAATVVGTTSWPDRGIDSTTVSGLRQSAKAGTARVLWTRVPGSRDGTSSYLGVFGGRPVVTFQDRLGNGGHDVSCRAGVQGLDPTTGQVAWTYSRPSECEDDSLKVDAASDIVRLRYETNHVAPSTTVYVDPDTGRVLHPGGYDDAVTTWVGRYGVIGATLRGFDSIVRVVDARSGRSLFTTDAPTCPGRPTLANTVEYPAGQAGFAATSSGRIAIAYGCVTNRIPYIPRLAVLGPSGVRTVALPPTYEEFPVALPIIASGELVVVRYPSTGSKPTPQDVVAGVDAASGRLTWTTYLPTSDDAPLYAAGSVLVTHRAVLDAATGAVRHPSGPSTVQGDLGAATPNGDWLEATGSSGLLQTTLLTTRTLRTVSTKHALTASLADYTDGFQVGYTPAGVVLASGSGSNCTLIGLGG